MITDYLNIDDLLTDEQKLTRNSVRAWIDKYVIPIIDELNQQHRSPIELIKQMGELGVLGSFIPEKYGGSGFDQITYGLIMQELERGDSAIRSAASVQTSLVMYPICEFGNEEQRMKFLPKLANGEFVGAFGLTEPNHGSDPGSMETKFSDEGDCYLLNGSKMWITNAPICDIAVVWAKNEQNKVRALIVEKEFEGFSRPETFKKWSLRASATGELVFDNVKVPKENLLPNISGLKGPMMCLNSARYGIAWGVLGAGFDCFNTALQYSQERKQFNKPIASFQLTQKKLAEMLTELTSAQLMALRVGQLKNENKATPAQISMVKRNNVHTALKIARESRQILGAMGISGDFPIMRHMMNLESVITYEGTHDIHLLISGLDITGIPAFK
ncbi:MAG: acyl-CoA dehydrogenase family protein [Bacteroidales bacterium]|nr:acyl-CoA dehydrogenase family protein [Bacteroidales bacterium]